MPVDITALLFTNSAQFLEPWAGKSLLLCIYIWNSWNGILSEIKLTGVRMSQDLCYHMHCRFWFDFILCVEPLQFYQVYTYVLSIFKAYPRYQNVNLS